MDGNSCIYLEQLNAVESAKPQLLDLILAAISVIFGFLRLNERERDLFLIIDIFIKNHDQVELLFKAGSSFNFA